MKHAKNLALATIAALGIGAGGPALSGSGYGHSSSAASVESMSSDSTGFSTQSSIANAGSESFPIPYSSADSGFSYDVYTVTLSDDSYFAMPVEYVAVTEPTLYFTGGQWYSYADGTWYSLSEDGDWIAMSDEFEPAYYAVYSFEPELVAEPIEIAQFEQPEYTLTVYSPDGSVLHVMGDDQSTIDSLLASVLDGSISAS